MSEEKRFGYQRIVRVYGRTENYLVVALLKLKMKVKGRDGHMQRKVNMRGKRSNKIWTTKKKILGIGQTRIE